VFPNIVTAGRYAVLDLETTGLSNKTAEPVQLAFGLVDHGRPQLRGYYTLSPGVPVTWGASRVHGHTKKSLKHSPRFRDIAAELFGLLDDRIILGYNAKRFDVPILARMFAETAPKYADWAPHVLDVLLWDRKFAPGGKHDLKTVATRLGLPTDGMHDAWYDCRLTWQVFGAHAITYAGFGAAAPLEAVYKIDDPKFQYR